MGSLMDNTKWQAGINLGGWISQYPIFEHEHFKTFILGEDIKRIAGWGADHVRLPVDYPVLESDQTPGVYHESGFGYIESCLNWCQDNQLDLILDLHKAPGYAFDALSESTLFTNAGLQNRYVELWAAIAERYAGQRQDSLAFELLNEIVLPDSGPWNDLISRVVARIRAIDPGRLIIVGGNNYNSPDELKNLRILDDPTILYAFHFYAPLTVTHQKAPWVPALVDYNQQVNYPGQAPGLDAFLEKHPQHRGRLGAETGKRFDKDYLRSILQTALAFRQETGKPIYCGEFGVYEIAPPATRVNWTRDVIDLLREHVVGHAIWTYKALDFGLVDQTGSVVNQELIDLSLRK